MLDYVLYKLAKRWRPPMGYLIERLEARPGTEEYARKYAQDQFNRKVRVGLGISIEDKDVLEIGCGHGGISCFLAVAGAHNVVGIDFNAKHLRYAQELADQIARRVGSTRLPLEFMKMDAYHMALADNSFDVVVADNAFEHFTDAEGVMRESHRVLRPGGGLLVPNFSSIKSKYGAHLKYGLNVPWPQHFFSVPTIVKAMRRLAADDPMMWEVYPGLRGDPKTFADLRPHKDLNDMSFKKFYAMAKRVGFRVEWFIVSPSRIGGRLVKAIPPLKKTPLYDVFSIGAAAYLVKK